MRNVRLFLCVSSIICFVCQACEEDHPDRFKTSNNPDSCPDGYFFLQTTDSSLDYVYECVKLPEGTVLPVDTRSEADAIVELSGSMCDWNTVSENDEFWGFEEERFIELTSTTATVCGIVVNKETAETGCYYFN